MCRIVPCNHGISVSISSIMDLSEHEFRDLVFAELNSCDVSKTSLKSLKKILEERLNCDLKEVN